MCGPDSCVPRGTVGLLGMGFGVRPSRFAQLKPPPERLLVQVLAFHVERLCFRCFQISESV